MVKLLAALGFLLACASRLLAEEVLIVADEFPAMEVLAAKLKAEERIVSKLVSQTNLPGGLDSFAAVVVYIHGALSEAAESAFIDYANGGGKLVLLHHSISSGKRKNPHWFSFLGVALPEGQLSEGGYKWIEGVTLELVNLNQSHFIMTNRVTYPGRFSYATINTPGKDALPGFTLRDSEVYLNHVHTKPRTQLMGVRYTDEKTGKTYMQDHAGWIRPAGKGWVIYLMPGHTRHDFDDPTYSRIVLNAVIFKP